MALFLAPNLFPRMLLVGHIIGQHDVLFHFNADDTQFYLSFNPEGLSSLFILHNCLFDIRGGITKNLQLQTEIQITGPDPSLSFYIVQSFLLLF